MTDTIALMQSREAGFGLGGFSRRTFTHQQDICPHRPQHVIAKGSSKFLELWTGNWCQATHSGCDTNNFNQYCKNMSASTYCNRLFDEFFMRVQFIGSKYVVHIKTYNT